MQAVATAIREVQTLNVLWRRLRSCGHLSGQPKETNASDSSAKERASNYTLDEDLHAALAGMRDPVTGQEGPGREAGAPAVAAMQPVVGTHDNTPAGPQQSGIRGNASRSEPTPTAPSAAGHDIEQAAVELPNRGFAVNRLAGAGRLDAAGNPPAPVRVQAGPLNIGRGPVAADNGAWDRAPRVSGGRGVKRDRPTSRINIVVDYNPTAGKDGLLPGMPSAKEIGFYAKKALNLLLRSCSAHGVTYWPTDEERNVALLTILRCFYDVCQLDVDNAMRKPAYSKVVNKLWAKFRSDSSAKGRRQIVDGLELEVSAPGIYCLEVDQGTKDECWGRYGPKDGDVVSSWSCEEGDLRPFTSLVFFQACKAAYPDWVFGGNLVLVPYHIAWVLFSVSGGWFSVHTKSGCVCATELFTCATPWQFDFGMQNMRTTAICMTPSPLDNEGAFAHCVEGVLAVIREWLAVARGRWYCPKVQGFRWGKQHLYVNVSDLEEYMPVQYGGLMDRPGDMSTPWLV
ncbi:unnamed protein product [Closterium sp. Yama58-4]|nr:unnamed protein product [Closterium sp. Yama58-4]